MTSGPRRQDITGQKFGSLIAIKINGFTNSGRSKWLCKCDCGGSKTISISDLRNGKTVRCALCCPGNIKHGLWHTRSRESWSAMKSRCFNPKNQDYYNYGGRGITVCDRWLVFENFYKDMGDRDKGYSLERLNPNGNYCAENCKWIPLRDQYKNRRPSSEWKIDKRTLKKMSEGNLLEQDQSRLIKLRLNNGTQKN